MKASVEVMLSAWGKWAMAGYSRSLGFAPVSPMFRDARPGRGYESSLPSGLGCGQMLVVDSAVASLPAVLRIVVVEFYQIGGSAREVGVRIGISHVSLGKYLTRAHEELEKVIC